MNQRASTRTSLRLRQASHALALLLLPALAPGFSLAVPRPRPAPGKEAVVQPRRMPQAYLRVVGAPPLRFVEATPPPDLVTRPPAAGTPPVLAANHDPELELLTEETMEELTEQSATTEVVDPMPVAESPTPAAAEVRTEPISTSEGPAPILPDDTRPSLQPEDFLPFFQMPGTGRMTSDVTVIAPVPRQAPPPPAQPPSSATYRQTP